MKIPFLPINWARGAFSAIMALCMLESQAASMWVYVGTYTGGKSKGIYVYEMDGSAGTLKRIGVVERIQNPSFLALHPNGRFLYAVSEGGQFQGKPGGGVAAYAVDANNGMLTLLNEKPSGGGGPCHLNVDPSGSCLLVANYGGGSISVVKIQDDGSLGETTSFIQHEGSSVNTRRQKEPHAHSIDVAPSGNHVYVSDLGMDKVMIYRLLSTTGELTPNEPAFVKAKPGAGPRHFAIHPAERFAYGINELDSTIAVYSRNAEGGLETIQTVSTLPQGFEGGNSTAEVYLSPDGKHLYGSNRGHDSIAVFSIDDKTGNLALVEHESTQGKTPRSFGIDPFGKFLLAANQNSDSIVVFQRDARTGALTPTGEMVETPNPVCVQFLKR